MRFYYPLQSYSNLLLRDRRTLLLHVGRLAEHQRDALVANSRDTVEVNALSVDRRIVYLIVARMEYASAGIAYRQRESSKYRVRDADELYAERAELLYVAVLDDVHLGHVHFLFRQLVPYQRYSKRRTVNRNLTAFRKKIRYTADMVFVSVRDKYTFDFV